jgi:hypothetical protein
LTYLRAVPLDAAVPKIERVMSPGSIVSAKPVAGGMFRATVPTTVRFTPKPTDPDPLEHVVVLELDVRGGRLICTSCTVEADPKGPPVTADALRRIPVGHYIRQAANSDDFLVMEVDPADRATMRPFARPAPDFAAGGMSDEVLREVARVYHWALVTGEPPLGVLEREYGVPRGKASRWIATARRRGLIKDDDDGR